MVHVRSDQYFIFCWKVEVRPDPILTQKYLLLIKARLIDARTSDELSNSDMNVNITSSTYQLFSKAGHTVMKVQALKQMSDINTIDVAIYFRNMNFFAIY